MAAARSSNRPLVSIASIMRDGMRSVVMEQWYKKLAQGYPLENALSQYSVRGAAVNR